MTDPFPSSPSTSKLPKFLQKSHQRSSTSRSDSTFSASSSPDSQKQRKSAKFFSKDESKSLKPSDNQHVSDLVDDPPIIIEPLAIPRTRSRSDRPPVSAPDSFPSYSSSNSRISDLPNRLSGWFHHTFSSSSTDLSTLLAQQAMSVSAGGVSKGGKGPNALLMAAKHGKGHLDKAFRYLLDSDAVPDKCSDPIWLLGVQHPGYEPPPAPTVPPPSPAVEKKRRSSASPPISFRSSISSTDSPLSQSTSSLTAAFTSSTTTNRPNTKHDPSANWPPAFYLDFTSRLWLTYRSQFAIPIRDIRLGDLSMSADNWEPIALPSGPHPASLSASTGKKAWPWGGEKTWSTDSGWGCMLRTGQSLLANALVHTHLGRDWRRPPYPVHTADYATYVQILTWFFDTPSPEAPFSVHRMALAGKEFGTDVGQWFGPSVAAGAIRTLVSQFPECGLSVAVATDSTLYQSQVFSASHGDLNGTLTTNYRSPRRQYMRTWGDKPVLLLLGIRLGIECVNPIYYDTIKRLYEFPQSVGIAGGRPSSSYYFVGSQADNLFYLDPHHARPAIPLRPTPSAAVVAAHERGGTTATDDEDGEGGEQRKKNRKGKEKEKEKVHSHSRGTTSTRSASSSVSSHYPHMLSTPPPPPHAPLAPSPLQQQFSSSSNDSGVSYSTASTGESGQSQLQMKRRSPPPPPPSYSPGARGSVGRWRSASQSVQNQSDSPRLSTYSDSAMMDSNRLGGNNDNPQVDTGLELVQEHYCTAYRVEELKTFHCERVRKMPMSGLDPSMLIGFICRDEEDWWDFRRRAGELPRTIFSVQDEPPSWPSDSDDNMGLESMSEPDPDELELEDEGIEMDGDAEGNEDEAYFDTHSSQGRGNKSEDVEVDTEEDPVGPITPGPVGSRFEFVDRAEERTDKLKETENDEGSDEGGGGNDIEDDWADPLDLVDSTSIPGRGSNSKDASPSPPSSSNVPPLVKSRPTTTKSVSSLIPKVKSKKERPVPVPGVVLPQKRVQEHYPFPVTTSNNGDDLSSSSSLASLSTPVGVDGRSRHSSVTRSVKQLQLGQQGDQQQQQQGYRMHTARARDGGRTQSGGVKGVLFSEPSG